jgi:hypothetical protein
VLRAVPGPFLGAFFKRKRPFLTLLVGEGRDGGACTIVADCRSSVGMFFFFDFFLLDGIFGSV